jgi:hypothetical protein
MPKTHYFPEDRVHHVWDNEQEPVLTVEPQDTVVYHTREVSDGQIGPDSTVDVLDRLDWDSLYPLAGPGAMTNADPATYWRSRYWISIPQAGAGAPSYRASGCYPRTSPTPTSRSSTSPTAITRCSRTTSPFP